MRIIISHLKSQNLTQPHNYLYCYKESLIAENYPEAKQYLTEIVQKTYSNSLKEDEIFFIYSQFEKGEISVLFSTKALIENLIKQCQHQPSFIHRCNLQVNRSWPSFIHCKY